MSRTAPSGFSLSYASRMLIVLALGWATLQTGRFLLSPLLPRITDALAFSPAGIGLALTGLGLVYAVTQYPSGTYSDQLTRATVIVPGFLVLLAGFVVVGFSVSRALFVAGVLLLGLGKGLYASPSRAFLGDLFESRQGRVLGIYAAGTDVGGLIAAGLAILVLATVTWRVAFVPVVLALAAVTLLFVVWNGDPYEVHRVHLRPGETAGRIVATQEQREMVVAFSLFYFFVGGLTNFFPMLLVDGGFSETVAGASFALLFTVGILTKPTAGEISDRFPRLGVSILSLTLAAAGVVLVVLAPSLPAVVLGTIMTAVGYKTQFPIIDAIVIEAAPDDNVGGDLGAARAIFLTASAAGPGVVGVLADLLSFGTAFLVLAGGLLLGAGVLFRQYRHS